MPLLTCLVAAVIGDRASRLEGAPEMSSNRPEREEDSAQPGAPERRPTATRSTPVSGPADVQARLELHLSQCRRRGGVLALLHASVEAIDCPGGQVIADMEQRVRQEVSNRIGNAVRASDSILRESDRDTCVVLPGANAAEAERVGRRLERLLNGDYRIAGELLQVSVSVGAAAHPEHGLRASELLRRAADRD
jgi:diguanylate cyclase (GGDEF)-like protein